MCLILQAWILDVILIALVSKFILIEWLSELGAQGICATDFRHAQGNQNLHCAKFESHTNRVTFETNAIRMTSSIQALRKLSDFSTRFGKRLSENFFRWISKQKLRPKDLLLEISKHCNSSAQSKFIQNFLVLSPAGC